MKRSGFLPFFLPRIRVGGLKERRRVSHRVYLHVSTRFLGSDRGDKDAALPRCTRGISPFPPPPPSPAFRMHDTSHSRGICGRRVEYVPGYVRRPGIPSAVFPARNVATSPGVRLPGDDIFLLPLPPSVHPYSRVIAVDFASTSRCICNR